MRPPLKITAPVTAELFVSSAPYAGFFARLCDVDPKGQSVNITDNLNERLSLDGPDDEFRELSATLDDLLGRLETSFAAQRRFVANASHELRTPLTLDRALSERILMAGLDQSVGI